MELLKYINTHIYKRKCKYGCRYKEDEDEHICCHDCDRIDICDAVCFSLDEKECDFTIKE
jgi:hypothetical protein